MKIHKDLLAFIELLTSQQVEFLVVGGHAVAYHGFVRHTGDIDFLLRSTRENADRVVRAIQLFSAVWESASTSRRRGAHACRV